MTHRIGHSFRERNAHEEKTILPEISAAGRGTPADHCRIKNESETSVLIAAFVPESRVWTVLAKADWGLDPLHLVPACTKYSNGKIEYFVHGSEEGYQSLVIERDFHGIKRNYEEIAEEFRLFHNLYFDRKNNKYIKAKKDGTEHDVILLEDGNVAIRAVELKQFLAGRTCDWDSSLTYAPISRGA